MVVQNRGELGDKQQRGPSCGNNPTKSDHVAVFAVCHQLILLNNHKISRVLVGAPILVIQHNMSVHPVDTFIRKDVSGYAHSYILQHWIVMQAGGYILGCAFIHNRSSAIIFLILDTTDNCLSKKRPQIHMWLNTFAVNHGWHSRFLR